MNANAAVFQSMYHNPNSVQQGQGMQQGMGSGSEDGKSDSQQQNEYQGTTFEISYHFHFNPLMLEAPKTGLI